MTLAIFPDLDGVDLDWSVRPEFKTSVFQALSGVESRIMLRQYPLLTFKLSMEFLIENRDEQQLTSLLSFILERGGMYEAFLYSSPHDNSCIDETTGYGDGVRTSFSLQRNYGGKVEAVQNINGDPIFYNNGIQTFPSMSSDGILTFPFPPNNGNRISWTGSYYYKCRFLADGYDFIRIARGVYECRDIEFIGSLRNLL